LHIPDRCFCGTLTPAADEVVQHLIDQGFRNEVVAYAAWIAATEGNESGGIFDFDPKKMVSRTLRSLRKLEIALGMGLIGDSRRKAIMSAMGQGDGMNFLATEEAMKNFPDPDEILKNPDTAPIPTEIDQQYAIAVKVASALNPTNSAAVFTYLNRFKQEEIAHTAVTAAIKRIARNNVARRQDGEPMQDVRQFPGFGDYALRHQALAMAMDRADKLTNLN
jgi:hypothetical protein